MPRCALCLQDSELCESHLIPAAFHRMLKSKEQELLVILEDKTFNTSKEIKQKLLCKTCEGRIAKREKYVLSRGVQRDGSFPLRSAAKEARVLCDIREGAGYRGADIPSLDTSAISYFALSVFWRGSVTRWTYAGRKLTTNNLGEKYENAIRAYLLDEAEFPKSARLVVLLSRGEPHKVMHAPISWNERGFHVHRFVVPGFQFILCIGSQHPSDSIAACFRHNSEHPIFLCDWSQDLARRDFTELMKTSELSKKMKLKFCGNAV